MSFFDLPLNEMATWVYVLAGLLFIFFLRFFYAIGFLRAEKKFKFYVPFTGDLPKGAIYEVAGKIKLDNEDTYLFLHRLDTTYFFDDIVIRPSLADSDHFQNFKTGVRVKNGIGGLRII